MIDAAEQIIRHGGRANVALGAVEGAEPDQQKRAATAPITDASAAPSTMLRMVPLPRWGRIVARVFHPFTLPASMPRM